MKKADRQKIFDKYGGRCAYCGCELQKGWHVDEIEPVRRKRKWVDSHWQDKVTGETVPQKEVDKYAEGEIYAKYKWVEGDWVNDGYSHPERLHLDNQNPACASCNINKHSDSLEDFRKMIAYFIETLNKNSVQYKIAKRYGLIQETGIDVKFFFETING